MNKNKWKDEKWLLGTEIPEEEKIFLDKEKHKCKSCGKLCYGTLCKECFRKNTRRGQLSRMRSLK